VKRRYCHSAIPCRASVALVALAWGSIAFGGEIHEAVQGGDIEKIKVLLRDNPALINSTDEAFGRTPLITAVDFGKKDVARALLASKADVDARDRNGWTALHHAADGGWGDLAELLLLNKADLNARTTKGPTPVFVGDAGVDADGHFVIKRRAVNKADGNTEATAGWAPLHLAALEDKKEIVALLLTHEADVNAQTANGWMALRWAASKGNKDVADLLRQHGGHEYASGVEGRSPASCLRSCKFCNVPGRP
jgi:ankyrin repeat protein